MQWIMSVSYTHLDVYKRQGNIHSDFALDFLKKNEACLIAADKGLEFFLEHQLLPDAVIGDFDSRSEDGKKFLEIHEERSMDSEIPYGGMTEWKLQKGFGNEKKEIKVIRLRPEKDDSDTQSAMNYAIRTGAKKIVIFGVTGNRVDHLMANFGLLVLAQNQGAEEMCIRDRIHTACGEGVLILTEVQLEGKKRMETEAFLRGYHIENGIVFTDHKE